MLRSLVRVQLAPRGGCSSAGRAPALQAGGRGFESHHLHLLLDQHFTYDFVGFEADGGAET